jgi:protein-tyrosine phosphatase
LSFPIEDRSVPLSLAAFDKFLNDLNKRLSEGKRVAIHCRAGIGRSTIIAACLLLWNGFSAGAAFEAVEKARGIFRSGYARSAALG